MLEIVLVAPAVLLIVVAAISWLGYFRLSYQVQDIADRALAAARYAPEGVAPESLAIAAARDACARQGLDPTVLHVTLQQRSRHLSLLLAYDASRAPAFLLEAIMPMPSATIVRLAQ